MRHNFLIAILTALLICALLPRAGHTQAVGVVSANLQLAGTAADGNSGNKSAGTQRVVIATDQPQLTNKLLVTPDANSAVNVAQVNGTTVDTNSGNKSAGTQRFVLATDQPNLTTALNVSAAQSGTYTVQPGNTANTTPWLFQTVAGTSGGYTPYFYESTGAANQDATAIKGSAGNLGFLSGFNTTTSIRYVWIYNVASGATSASTVVGCLVLPGFTTGSGAVVSIPVSLSFTTGISIRITTGFPGSSTAAASTGDVFLFGGYN